MHAIHFGGTLACDGGTVLKALFPQHLDAAGCVISRYSFHLGQEFSQRTFALRQALRVRVDTPNVFQVYAGQRWEEIERTN